jgi:hypothetical protein
LGDFFCGKLQKVGQQLFWGSFWRIITKLSRVSKKTSAKIIVYLEDGTGDRTLDDTIKLINDRVTVYINEVK